MSKAKILDLSLIPELGNLDFPNLEANLERRLEQVQTLPDLQALIKLMNPLLKDERFTREEQSALRRLRQRAYDRRRNPKFQITNTNSSKPKIQISQPAITVDDFVPKLIATPQMSAMNPNTTNKEATAQKRPANNFGSGVLKAISNIDGEMFANMAPKFIAWLAAASAVSFFLWHQSLDLYRSAGFTNATYAAAGGLLMIVGFAAYHSISRSWLALLCCLYAGAYESYLMVSGTIHDDIQTHADAVQSNQELIFLQEKVDKEHSHYVELKQRYENPESKVYKNEWFLKTHLNPAWESNIAANKELVAKRAALVNESNVSHVTWLKILYRLGLVLLCMMLVHQFFASCRRSTFTTSKIHV